MLQAHFVAALGQHFTVKPIKRKRLCALEGYHDLVQVWACKKKRCKAEGGGSQQQKESVEEFQANEGEGEMEDEGEREGETTGSKPAADEEGK